VSEALSRSSREPDRKTRGDPGLDRPKLWGICLVKDEDDIIAQTLTYATRYCDRIFVLDNGSTDGTWHIVRRLAEQNEAIVPFAQTLEPYGDGLRAVVYNAMHGELSPNDWWLILDADEFLAEDPWPVIEAAVRENADIVKTWHIHFFFTDRDLEAWEQRSDRRDLPIFDRRRYYLINWQEPRLFRNNPQSFWNASVKEWVPDTLRKVCRRRIFVRHYQYRDPEQIEKRQRLRYALRLRDGHFPHVKSPDWRTMVVNSASLSYHNEGQPWRLTASGIVYYYRHAAIAKYRGALRRLRRLLGRSGRVAA